MTTALDKADRSAGAIKAFEKALGGRHKVADSLLVDTNPAIQSFVKLLLDPDYDDLSLGQIAEQAGIALSDLLRSYRNATLIKAQILAVNEIAERLPQLARSAMENALPQEVSCPICRGTGFHPTKKDDRNNPLECKLCAKTGKVLRQPSIGRQRLALEIAELLKPPKPGGHTLNVNLPPAPPAGPVAPGSLEQLQAAVSHVLFSRTPVIDATPEPPAEAGGE